jgi:hypothetical protein
VNPYTSLVRRHTNLAWFALVAAVYGAATLARMLSGQFGPDPMMDIAVSLTNGHAWLQWTHPFVDVVLVGDVRYQAMSLGPTLPYLPLAPFEALWPYSRWIVSIAIGVPAAWLALPVARRYGPGGSATWWLAALGAFGTMLFTLTIEGDFYYLAHLEAVALSFLLLIEWHDRRRAWVLATLIGLAWLARPTLILVALPIGALLIWESKERLRTAAVFATPLIWAIGVGAWWNFVRFADPLQTGYGISLIGGDLLALRDQGVFSIVHVPTNLALFLGGGYTTRPDFPWLVANSQGQSIFLTTPALLIAIGASLRDRLNLMLWATVVLTAIPVFLFYGGGGGDTYGYRYAMDFVPFLFALVAVAVRTHFGRLEKALIAMSVAFIGYGFVWAIFK